MSTESRNTPAPLTFGTRKKERFDELTLTLRFITPMFGGGTTTHDLDKAAHNKVYDEVTPVRGSAIRGHLRFWWRATTGAWCSTIEEMKRQEDELFGAAVKTKENNTKPVKGPGLVGVRVDCSSLKAPNLLGGDGLFKQSKGRWSAKPGHFGIGYGAFPLLPERENLSSTPGNLFDFSNKGEFLVSFTFPPERLDEIKLVLSAWIAFGGLGGRTRRGFGRIALSGTSEQPLLSASEIKALMAQKPFPAVIKAVPSLSLDKNDWVEVVSRTPMKPKDSLEKTLDNYKKFRGAKEGKTPLWPEKKLLESLVKRNERLPSKDYYNLPRASFGMPIAFHDAKGGGINGVALYPSGTINGKGVERFPSRLLLAPMPDGKTVWAIKMRQDGPHGISIRKDKNEITKPRDFKPSDRLQGAERLSVLNYEITKDTDAVSAFMSYLKYNFNSN